VLEILGQKSRQVVILSGKGGTGKTTVCAAFAHLTSLRGDTRAVLVDADVDASNLELVLSPHCIEKYEFYGGQVAAINPTLCTGCGICAEVCRFEAVTVQDGRHSIDSIACEGCATCMTQCPTKAIRMEPQLVGHWFQSESRYGPLFHAALSAGAENSGKLVALVKQQACRLGQSEAYPLMIVDGPPGIGCPVIAAASGADLAVIVAEPTAAGIEDMERTIETTRHFGVPSLVCVNKADVYPPGLQTIESFCRDEGLPLIARIPFDTAVTEAMVQGQPVTVYQPDGPVSQALHAGWNEALNLLDRVR
jgi:MinD superfamily P-loop ATPase